MKICPTCGEVYPDRTQACRAHDVLLEEWSETTGSHPGAFTDVERRAHVTTAPFELGAIAGELGGAVTPSDGAHDPALAETPHSERSGSAPRLRAPSRGRVLGGRYRLGTQLGIGGYGAVFAAETLPTGDRVAIKVLSPAAAQSPELITRFHREAIAASRARHRHIVEISDFDVDDDGSQYIVMERLDGRDLADVLDDTGTLSPARALVIAAQCARGLAAVHRVGVLHRDLKPANVFLVRRADGAESVKIIDFGISKLTRAAGDYTDVTSASKVVGTPCYMSPEQACGVALDARCDVYALGVMLFEMLVGERPFTGRSPIEILSKHLEAPRVPPSTLRPELAACPGLDELVVTALARDRSRRFASMVELGDAVVACLRALDPEAAEAVAEPTGETTDPDVAPRRASPPIARERGASTRARSAGLALTVVVLAAAVAVLVWLGREDGAAAPTTSASPMPAAPRAVEPAAPAAGPVARTIAVPVAMPVAVPVAAPPAPTEPVADARGPKEIELTSSPPGAGVIRDGERLGITPLRIVLEAGVETVELSLEAPGRQPRRVVVGRDRDTVDVVLRARPPIPRPRGASNLGVEEW